MPDDDLDATPVEPVATVLLVEDSRFDAMVVRRSLRRGSEYDVHHASSVEEARQLVADGLVPDVVLADLGLPDAEGTNAIGALKKITHAPVVVLTGNTLEEVAESAAAEGADDFLTKDELKPPILRRAIRYAIQRHQRNTQLAAAEAPLRAIISANVDAMVVFRAEGGIVFTNAAASALFGRSDAELLGTSLELPYTVGGRQESSMERPPAGAIAVETTVSETSWENSPALLASIRDVDALREQELLQEQMRQSERLISIGRLSTGVAHEINNPAMMLKMNAEPLQDAVDDLERSVRGVLDRASGISSADRKRITDLLQELRQIHADNLYAIDRLASVTSDLLTFARMEVDDDDDVDIDQLVQATCNLARAEVKPYARLEFTGGSPPPFRGNRGRIGQVVMNLLVNAAHAVREADSRAERVVHVSTRLSGSDIRIQVSDNGVGIPPEHLSKIFEPFWTTKPRDQGTGLGLALCQELIRRYGGRIDVESALGEGSTFTVVLPTEEEAGAPIPARPPRVLIVDDEPVVARSLARALSRSCDVQVMTSANDALTQLEEDDDIDVILCDLMMPGMSGVDLHLVLRTRMPHLVKRLVFFTGGATTAAARAHVKESGVPVLQKPVALEQLRATIEEVAARP